MGGIVTPPPTPPEYYVAHDSAAYSMQLEGIPNTIGLSPEGIFGGAQHVPGTSVVQGWPVNPAPAGAPVNFIPLLSWNVDNFYSPAPMTYTINIDYKTYSVYLVLSNGIQVRI